MGFADIKTVGNTQGNQNVEGFSDCIVVGNIETSQTTEILDVFVYPDKVRVYTKSLSYYREYHAKIEKEIAKKICKKKNNVKHSYKEVEKRNKFFK